MTKSLAEMAAEVREVNQLNGWYPTDRTFGDGIALLHSEASEALEAYRQWGTEDQTESWDDPGCLTCHRDNRNGTHDALQSVGHLSHDFRPALPKPEGVGSEFADILIRLLDMAKEHGIDLEAEYERKIEHNKVRGWRHGGKRL